MTQKDTSKLLRLYCPSSLSEGQTASIEGDQNHYVRAVMRLEAGKELRLFNGEDGEWLCNIQTIGKKSSHLSVLRQIRAAESSAQAPVHLYFAPIKKQRLESLILHAVELGATHLTPVLTAYTENRKFKAEKIQSYIMEATEQSERLSPAILNDALSFDQFLSLLQKTEHTIYTALERHDAPLVNDINIAAPCGFLIGPEGGFSDDEKAKIEMIYNAQTQHDKRFEIVSLGKHVLRSETAALFCLSQVKF